MSQSWKTRSAYTRKRPSASSSQVVNKVKSPFRKIFKKIGVKSLIGKLAVLAVFAALIGGIFFVASLAYVSKDLPEPDKLIDRSIAQTTKIYDRTGEHLLYEIHGDEKRTLLKLEDIPDHAQKAVIALEDKNFYEHHGLSYKRLGRAVIDYGLRKVLGRQVDLSGASTITQQLVKNAILSPEKTFTRKFKEWILTIQIERKFEKDQILQLYFNEIPYGSTAYGIEAAANLYFDKSATDLTLRESSILAAIIQRPTYYSPYGSHKDALMERANLTLDLMVGQEYITQEEADAAKNAEVAFKERTENIEAPHFVMYVRQLLSDEFGEKLVEQGGLKVTTTLDYDLQKIAEAAVISGAENNERYNANNAALAAMNPQTGEIVAMVGSKDYFDTENDGNVNVTIAQRQPGSSFKPIVYSAAFEKGYTPETILYDVETDFPTATGNYHPRNYDLEERGPVTLRKALQGSLNIPAVKAMYLTGVDRVLDYADRLGYTTFADRSRFGLAVVLGGGEVKLTDHIAAFSVFANDGKKVRQVSILKVENQEGKAIYEKQKENPEQVIDNQVARLINNVLSDNAARAYVFGERSNLQLGGRPVAAKTGTTNSYRDAWTIGYTPSLVAGVWAGNNDNTEMNRGAGGSLLAAPIWNEFMRKALADQPIESFTAPAEIETDKDVLLGKQPEQVVRIDEVSGKLATEFTPEETITELRLKQAHNILHYLRKDNPRGDAPSSPETSDFMYKHWESGVQAWVEKNNEECQQILNGTTAEGNTEGDVQAAQAQEEQAPESEVPCVLYNIDPPTEFDDVHTSGNQPTIQIDSPSENETITSSILNANVTITSPRNIQKVQYFLDDELLTESYSFPFQLFYGMNANHVGFHTLTAKVFDDISNVATDSVLINYSPNSSQTSILWNTPSQSTQQVNLNQTQFPTILSFRLSDLNGVNSVELYSNNGSGDAFAGSVTSPSSTEVNFTWDFPGQIGDYNVYAVVKSSSGSSRSKSIRFTITE